MASSKTIIENVKTLNIHKIKRGQKGNINEKSKHPTSPIKYIFYVASLVLLSFDRFTIYCSEGTSLIVINPVVR